MNTVSAPSQRHPVEQLAEDFVTRIRNGEHPSLSEYVKQYPEVSGELADIIQALLMLEDLGAASDSSTQYIQMPEQLGEYRILRELGRGGMGVVYEAEQIDLGRRVALKVLPTAALLRPTHLERFRREARAAARLHHTNIVPVFGVGVQDGIHYYAMQHIAGRGLDAILSDARQSASDTAIDSGTARITPLTGTGSAGSTQHYRAVARIGLQIAEALAHAHQHGVLHRDIKPSNILIDENGDAWLGDFGLAQLEGDAPLTSTGGFVGTLRYLPPERFHGEGDARSDVYALGVTLFELITLRPMYDETDRPKLIHKITQESTPSLRQIDHNVPKDLETIILKAIARDPADRYADAGSMVEDLRRFLADRPVAARRPSPWEQLRRWVRRNPLIASLSSAIILSLVAGLIATWWQWRRADENLTAKTNALIEVDRQRTIAQRESDRAWQALRVSLTGMSGTYAKPLTEMRRGIYEEMLRLHEDLATDTNPQRQLDRAVIARGLGEAYFELGDPGKARQALESSVKLIEALPRDTVESQSQFGESLYQFAKFLNWQNKWQESDPVAAKAVTACRELLAKEPNVEKTRLMLARSLMASARARAALKQPDIESRNEAVEILKKLQVDQPDLPEIGIELVTVYQQNARRLSGQRKDAEAKEVAAQAVEVANAMLAKWPDRCDVIQAAAHACDALGTAHFATQSHASAFEHFRRGATFYRMLVAQDPQNATYNYSAAVALHNLARSSGQHLESAEAHRLLDESTKYINVALEISPFHLDYRRQANQNLDSRVILYMDRNDYRNVSKAAQELVDKVVGPTIPVEAAQRVLSCIVLVNRDDTLSAEEKATFYKEFRKQAAGYLKLAADRGYANPERLQKMPFLNVVKLPDFRESMAAIEANAKKAKPAAKSVD